MFSEFRKGCRKLVPEYASFLEEPPQGIADLALPCFMMAKEQKRPPQDIAREIAARIRIPRNSLVSRVEASGPYVNFFINYPAFMPLVLKAASKPAYGSGKKKKEKVMVEFSQPNTHKGFHIGHLRNTSLGDSLVQIMRFDGYKVVAANYIGDVGAHVAKAIWAYVKFYKGKEPKAQKGRWLGEVYADAVRKLKESNAYIEEYQAVLRKLYAHDSVIMAVWKKTRKMSLDEFNAIYKELGVKFDVVFYESSAEKLGKKFVMTALKKGLAKRSENAIVFDLTNLGLDTLVVLRNDGTPLYSTKDLGLAELKFKKYKIDKSIHVVAVEQAFYFKQLFKVLEIIGFPQASKCYHLPYELVMLKEGKMSSREGNIVLYEDLMKGAAEKAENELRKRDFSGNVNVVGKKIALAALKYSMLHRETNRVIIFDWDTALNFEGDTGPYLLYTYARCRSILRKSKRKPNAGRLGKEEEKLAKKLSSFPEMIHQASRDYKPHMVASYAFDLASVFNEYYHSVKVIDSDREKERLLLIHCVASVLKRCMELLGIETLEKM